MNLKVSKMLLGIWDLDNVFDNSPSDCICCLITAEKGIFSPTRSNAVKCHVISAAVWLWYFTDQSLYVHMSNSNENITQRGFANKRYQFQHKLRESHDLTLQPVITHVYLCWRMHHAAYISKLHSRIEQKLNRNVTQASENI
jgi:hypothetical protein